MDRIQRFRDARFGMFIHWGPYSLNGIEASWPIVRDQLPWATYHALGDQFNPQSYDPKAWAALAKAAGMKYAYLTTKHHDGYALFDTALSDYSAPKRVAERDLVREYVDAFREAGIMVGFYFSLCDWHHPDYPADIADGLERHMRPAHQVTPGAPASIASDPERWQRYLDFMFGQVRELLTNYGTIDLVWFDGQWERTAEQWKSAELVQMMRSLQPEIIINDRLGDPMLGDYSTPEQNVPVNAPNRPWETCMTINETWAYNPHDRAYKPARELIATLAEVTSKGGVFLLNVGPTPEGQIPPEFASRLEVIAGWMEKNQESIFACGGGLAPGAFYGPTTGSDDAIYLHVLGRPGGDTLIVRGVARRVASVSVLATGTALEFDQHGGVLEGGAVRITLPDSLLDPNDTVVKLQFA
ncbi:MAG: alpha-L-fucosidase [Thermomicrobiales bacterium]